MRVRSWLTWRGKCQHLLYLGNAAREFVKLVGHGAVVLLVLLFCCTGPFCPAPGVLCLGRSGGCVFQTSLFDKSVPQQLFQSWLAPLS